MCGLGRFKFVGGRTSGVGDVGGEEEGIVWFDGRGYYCALVVDGPGEEMLGLGLMFVGPEGGRESDGPVEFLCWPIWATRVGVM